MYEAHFGLKQRPFSENVNPSAFVSLFSHAAILRRLRYALVHDHGPAILVGPHGSGKTLLALRLASEMDVNAVHLTFPALSPVDLLAHLAQEFGEIPQPVPSPHVALRHLRSEFGRMVKNGERAFLIVDDAHLIGEVATFDTLRLLLNFTTIGSPDLARLFVGGPELLLDLPAGLADRLTARCLLGPLNEAESSAYIVGRLNDAGTTDPRFSERAITSFSTVLPKAFLAGLIDWPTWLC